jgi:hypothetical protein
MKGGPNRLRGRPIVVGYFLLPFVLLSLSFTLLFFRSASICGSVPSLFLSAPS